MATAGISLRKKERKKKCHMPVIAASREAEAGGWRIESQLQQKQGAKQLNETLSLSRIQNRAGHVAWWLSAP